MLTPSKGKMHQSSKGEREPAPSWVSSCALTHAWALIWMGSQGLLRGGRVAQIEVIQFVDAHPMKEGSGEDINAFGDFPVVVSDHLSPQEATRFPISGDTNAYLMSAGIVDFMIPAGRFDGERIKTCLLRFFIAQSCPGNYHLKHLDHLGAKRPGELPVTTNRVLTGYAPLLMGCDTQRQICWSTQKAMPGLDAIAGGIDIWHIRFHSPGDANGLALARDNASRVCHLGLRLDAHCHQYQVGCRGKPL